MTTFNFQVKHSLIHGLGLFALHPMPARRKLGEFTGERIPVHLARMRARDSPCVAIVEMGDGTALDAARNGNPFRRVNHSCSPNTFMRICQGRVEFYALREIACGEELTCDYGETHHGGRLRCRCRSVRCRGRL